MKMQRREVNFSRWLCWLKPQVTHKKRPLRPLHPIFAEGGENLNIIYYPQGKGFFLELRNFSSLCQSVKEAEFCVVHSWGSRYFVLRSGQVYLRMLHLRQKE